MTQIHRPRPHLWVRGEPSLEEMLNDPTIRLVMNRDGVRSEDLTKLCAIMRKRLMAGPLYRSA